MKKYYTLLDAVEMNIRHPDTFFIPSDAAINAIKPGDFVKLGFVPNAEARAMGAEMVERMWVEVSETDAARRGCVSSGSPWHHRLDREHRSNR